MINIYLELLPIFLLILVGFVLKKIGIVKTDEASLFLKMVFYVGMPALILSNVPYINIDSDLMYLPVIPFILATILFVINKYLGNKFGMNKKTLGVFIISALIINSAFILPFLSVIYGKDAVAMLLILDVGNAIVVFVFAYQQACKYGNNSLKYNELIKKFVHAIPLWAVIISLIMNFAGIKPYQPIKNFAEITGNITIPLLLISVGIFFDPKLSHIKYSILAIFVRMILSLFLGIAIAKLMGLEGILFKIAVIASATPMGYNVLTFSSIENLNKKFAANLVSISILFAFLFIPIVIYFLNN